MKLTIEQLIDQATALFTKIEAKLEQTPAQSPAPENVTPTFDVEDNKTEVKFMDVKTIDGTILRTEQEDFVIGAKVQVMAEDGTLTNAPDGEHTLEGGKVITIKDSVIVLEKEMEEEKPVDQAPTEELKKELATLKSELEKIKTEKVEMKSKIDELSKEPASKPITKSDTPTGKDVSKLSTHEQMAYVAMQLAKTK